MGRRGAAVVPLLLVLALPGCGLRVDSDTRQALLRNQLGQPTSGAAATGGTTGSGTTGSTGTGGTGGSGTGTTGALTEGTTGSTSGTTGSTSTSGSGATPPPGGNGGATDVGVTATTLTVGTIADQSGPRPGLFNGTIAGARAYFAYVNSQGGVYGRRLQTSVGDSGTACNQTADAHKALINKVFA
ncbi:MAG: ABC transporter substrate-binding protein, partial [Mycobacteriales bacterium]